MRAIVMCTICLFVHQEPYARGSVFMIVTQQTACGRLTPILHKPPPRDPVWGQPQGQAPLPLLAPSSPGPRHLQAEDGKCSSELAGQGGHAPCLPLLETRHHMAHGGSRLPSAIAQPGERCPASHPGLEAERPPRIGAQSARPPGHFTPRQNQGVTSRPLSAMIPIMALNTCTVPNSRGARSQALSL